MLFASIGQTTKRTHLIAGALIALHAIFSLHAMTRLSPAWDEIAYPYSGYVQLTTGSLEHYPHNPFLARLLSGLPFLFTEVETKPTDDPAADGFAFTYKEKRSPQTTVFLGRLSAFVFSLLLAFLIYWTARRQWSDAGGLLALVAYLTTPIFLSRASLGLVEMPMYVFIMLSLWWFEEKPAAAGAAMGLALLCKFAALPALAALLVVYFLSKRPKAALFFAAAALGLVLAAYLPWKGGLAALQAALADVFAFNKKIPYYFFGAARDNAPGVISLLALALKSPPLPVIFGLWGLWAGWSSTEGKRALKPFLFMAAAYLLYGTFTGAPVSTVQLSPVYLALAFAAGALASKLAAAAKRVKIAAGVFIALAVANVYAAHPNYLGYFNPAAGGTNFGHIWLGDSDQDWGQSLPSLARLLKRAPHATVFLAYSGAGKPEAYGINYVDFFSPSLASKDHEDAPLPMPMQLTQTVLVVGTKVPQAYREAFAWLANARTPRKIVDGNFLIYDVTVDPEAIEWMGRFYLETGRAEKAMWCLFRGKALRK